ncbi:lactonase family protein [Rugosimonospora acidiphila]|uniref:Lactonase family protein n=1 Tax=Rugosimonospora acidiphila TaxID=556531 RepID=A0ABP9SKJ5_9ACTN
MNAPDRRVYVGCYTNGAPASEAGIVSFALDGDGLLHRPTVTPASNPSFLASAGGLLYAAHETTPGRVRTYRRGAGGLTPYASTTTGGDGPAHVAVAADRSHLVIPNYASGHVTALTIDGDGHPGTPSVWVGTGSGPHPGRQQGSHPHQAVQLPTGTWLIPDLGTDAIVELAVRPGAAPSCVGRHPLPPGCGPRHLVVRDDWLFVAGELDSHIHGLHRLDGGYRWRWSVSTFDIDQIIACPTNDPSHIQLGEDRTHLYVANRGRDTITVFTVRSDAAGTRLELEQERSTEGHWPRHFAVTGDRLYVANQLSDRVCVFALDPRTATIGELLQSVDVRAPACVLVA